MRCQQSRRSALIFSQRAAIDAARRAYMRSTGKVPEAESIEKMTPQQRAEVEMARELRSVDYPFKPLPGKEKP